MGYTQEIRVEMRGGAENTNEVTAAVQGMPATLEQWAQGDT